MKTHSVMLFIPLLLIFAVSETSCWYDHWYEMFINTNGLPNYHNCTVPVDCQSGNCLHVNKSYTMCFPPKSAKILHFDTIYDICSYSRPRNKTLSDERFAKFGYNAAHFKFKTNDTVAVWYNGVNITVYMNGAKPEGETLEMCPELADALGFDEGVRECKIDHMPMNRRSEKSYYIEWTWRFLLGVLGSYLTDKYLHFEE